MSQFFASGGQSKGVSASASVLPMNIWDWFPLGFTGLISLQSKELSRVFLQHHSSKSSILHLSAFFMIQLSHPYMTTGKTIALTRRIFVSKVMSLLFNMLYRIALSFVCLGLKFTVSAQPLNICQGQGLSYILSLLMPVFYNIFSSSGANLMFIII